MVLVGWLKLAVNDRQVISLRVSKGAFATNLEEKIMYQAQILDSEMENPQFALLWYGNAIREHADTLNLAFMTKWTP